MKHNRREEVIYEEATIIAKQETVYGRQQREELEDLIAMLEKRRTSDVGFWTAQYEAGPLAGDDEIAMTILQVEQSYDEAVAEVKKQIEAL